jgi:hypothetical protein
MSPNSEISEITIIYNAEAAQYVYSYLQSLVKV